MRIIRGSIKLLFGPIAETSRIDRSQLGAAGGIAILAAIAAPVTIALMFPKHFPSSVLWACLAIAAMGLMLLVKTCQKSAPLAPSRLVDIPRIEITATKFRRSAMKAEAGMISIAGSRFSHSPVILVQRTPR
jgi:hypothetical protein